MPFKRIRYVRPSTTDKTKPPSIRKPTKNATTAIIQTYWVKQHRRELKHRSQENRRDQQQWDYRRDPRYKNHASGHQRYAYSASKVGLYKYIFHLPTRPYTAHHLYTLASFLMVGMQSSNLIINFSKQEFMDYRKINANNPNTHMKMLIAILNEAAERGSGLALNLLQHCYTVGLFTVTTINRRYCYHCNYYYSEQHLSPARQDYISKR